MLGGLSVAVSHGPIPPSITVFIEQLSGRAALCFASTSDPASIVEDVVEGQGRTHTVIGVLLKADSATLCRAGCVLGVVEARCAPAVLTLSMSATQSVVCVQGSSTCAADHGGVVVPTARYAALVWEGECRTHPCWTTSEDRYVGIM